MTTCKHCLKEISLDEMRAWRHAHNKFLTCKDNQSKTCAEPQEAEP